MQHGDGTLERRLYLRVATGGEGNFAKRPALGNRIVRVSGAVHGKSNKEWKMIQAKIHGALLC
jgi:hypothetical protein